MSATTNGWKIKFPLLLAQLCLQRRDSVWESLCGGLAVLQPCTGDEEGCVLRQHRCAPSSTMGHAAQTSLHGETSRVIPGPSSLALMGFLPQSHVGTGKSNFSAPVPS